MSDVPRPTYYYIFPLGADFQIRQMTDIDAMRLWEQGTRFIDVAQKTLADAEQVREAYRAEKNKTLKP